VLEFEGNSYNLTEGQYYLKGDWFEMLNGNKNWYVLTKYPEGQGNKCIVSLESILDMNLDMNKDDENVPKDKHSRAKALERGGAYHLPNEVHKHLLKECNERDEQEKRDEQVEEVRHYACARHILFIVTCMSFNISSLYIPTMEKAKKRKVCMCHTLAYFSSSCPVDSLSSQVSHSTYPLYPNNGKGEEEKGMYVPYTTLCRFSLSSKFVVLTYIIIHYHLYQPPPSPRMRRRRTENML